MFDLPEEALTAGDPLRSEGQGVRLPFAAPEIYWYNGKSNLADTDEIKDARRFGGWGIDAQRITELLPLLSASFVPSNWKLFETLRNGEGKNFSAYLTRSVLVAPIARRWRFLRTDKFTGSQVNILSYLAYRDPSLNNAVVPFGPVVLTAKRFSGNHVDGALNQFAQDTVEVRGETAARWFYHPIGTFGAAPIFEKKTGKGGQSSEITPCAVGKPKDGWDTPAIEALFVGKDIAAKILDLGFQAQAWAHDWDKKVEEPAYLKEDPGF